ncbi:TldD/PmbA family protein [Candidatus Bipolaricaulota bacterium]
MMHEILTRAAKKCDQAEVYHLQRKIIPVQFDAQGLSVIKTKQSEGVALRTIREGRLGYATTTDLSHPDEVVEAAAATAAFGDATELAFPSESPDILKGIDNPALGELPAERLVDLGERIREAILQDEDGVEVGLTVQTIVDQVRVSNTAGLDIEERVTAINVSLEATRARAGDIFTVSDSCLARSLDVLSVDRITQRIRWLLNEGREVVSAPSGSMPVVFTPAGALAVFLPIAIGLNGKSALLGTSPLRGKQGQQVFDERLSVFDDGRCESGARAGSFDDEGVPTSRTILADKGVLRNFFYDLRTAKQAEVHSTGNGFKGGFIGGRNFRPSPSPTISQFVVGEGDVSDDDLVRGIKKGLIVDTVLGLGQGNVNAGDFSNNVGAAFLVEDGKIVGRVKNVMIAGNSYDLLLNHLIGLSNQSKWTYGRFRSPSIALGNVSVAAK